MIRGELEKAGGGKKTEQEEDGNQTEDDRQ